MQLYPYNYSFSSLLSVTWRIVLNCFLHCHINLVSLFLQSFKAKFELCTSLSHTHTHALPTHTHKLLLRSVNKQRPYVSDVHTVFAPTRAVGSGRSVCRSMDSVRPELVANMQSHGFDLHAQTICHCSWTCVSQPEGATGCLAINIKPVI